jgi:hypothetical protein
MQLKKSESGAALILLVSVIGLFFVLTVASFLLLSAVNQDSSRVASAKIDVALREEALMRAVLQQTALGMEPAANGSSSTWTNIMTAAVNQVLATQYVNPAEIAQIFGPNAPIVVNTGDTGGATLAIFQGYQPAGNQSSEVPNGGTTGVSGLVNPYDPTVQPPELVWVGNPNISAATAATNPLQFFLGSQVSTVGLPNTSPSGRWGVIPFPNIRFGFMQAGSSMVARRVWWRIPVVYQPTNGTVENAGVLRYPPKPANYVISIYEIPSQLPITGNANIQLGLYADGTAWGNTSSAANQVQISGSIYGDSVQLDGGTYSGGISSRGQVNIAQAASVAGQSYTSNNYNDLGVREQADLTRPIGAAPVSVTGDNGKVLLLPILPGQSFFNTAPGVPTAWDLYARPYYHCPIRITISGTNNALNYSGGQINTSGTTGAIQVAISYRPDVSQAPDAMFGVLDPPNASGWTVKTYQQTNNVSGSGFGGSGQLWNTTPGDPNNGKNSGFLIYTSTDSGNPNQDRNILEIDLIQLYAKLGLNPAQCYAIYLQCPASLNPNNPSAQNLGIVLTDASDLAGITTGPALEFSNGFSLVTPQPVYLLGSFNTYPFANGSNPPTSIYASDVRYGIDGAPVQINMTGQISVSQVNESSATPINPLSFSNAAGNSITGAGNTYKLNAITNPRGLPPITRLNLLFTVEKERPN